jgi:pilus assembly protein CpaB
MRVDVLVTVKPPGDEVARTSTILQNIVAVSAGQQIQPDSSGRAVNVPVVTLLVTPEQAETLTLAGNEGRIQLVLRNAADQTMGDTPGRRLTELYGRERPAAAPKPVAARAPSPAPAPPPPPPRDEIVVYRGVQRTVEVLQEGGPK